MRRATKILIFAVLAVVVLVVGGTYFYIHVIEGDAPAPLAITSETRGGRGSSNHGTATTVAIAGTWKPTTKSTVGYRVKEILFGQDATAVGRTNAVTGSFVVAGTRVTTASFTADMTKVKSDRSQRDRQFQGRIMDTARYPTATFELTSPISLGTIPAPGKIVTYRATGDLTLHGTTKPVTFPLKAARIGDTIQVNGSIPVTFAEWGIGNPSFGPVSTQDHGQLEFLLVFAK